MKRTSVHAGSEDLAFIKPGLGEIAVLAHPRGLGPYAVQDGGPGRGRSRDGYRNRRVIIVIADTSGLLAALDSALPEHVAANEAITAAGLLVMSPLPSGVAVAYVWSRQELRGRALADNEVRPGVE